MLSSSGLCASQLFFATLFKFREVNFISLQQFQKSANMIKAIVLTLLVCLSVVNAQTIICGRYGGVPCPHGKREQLRGGEIAAEAVHKPVNPFSRLSNWRSRNLIRTLYAKMKLK